MSLGRSYLNKKVIDDICKQEDDRTFNDPLVRALCSCNSCGKSLNPDNNERMICNSCLNSNSDKEKSNE